MAKWTDQGENDVLNIYLKNATQNSSLYLGLYKNSEEPPEDVSLSDLSEPSGNGYGRIALAPADWSISGDLAQQPQKTFQASGGDWGNVYGYFIATSSDNSGKLIAVEHFQDGPYNVVNGGSVKVTVKIKCA